MGYAYVFDKRIREGLSLIEEAIEQSKLLGMMFCHSISLINLGEALLFVGRLPDANEIAQRGLKLCKEYKAHGYEAWALRLLGDIFSDSSSFDAEKAENYYREAMSLANQRGMRPLLAHCHKGMDILYRKMGKKEETQDYLAKALTMYREMEMDFWLEKAQKDSERL